MSARNADTLFISDTDPSNDISGNLLALGGAKVNRMLDPLDDGEREGGESRFALSGHAQ
jgi:hypothetical protein